jgi:ABC-type sugar transport system ATPase subunit
MSYLFISHDLKMVNYLSRRVAVMYLGKIVETGPREAMAKPLHPYTQALIAAIPVPDPKTKRAKIILSGEIPSAHQPAVGLFLPYALSLRGGEVQGRRAGIEGVAARPVGPPVILWKRSTDCEKTLGHDTQQNRSAPGRFLAGLFGLHSLQRQAEAKKNEKIQAVAGRIIPTYSLSIDANYDLAWTT